MKKLLHRLLTTDYGQRITSKIFFFLLICCANLFAFTNYVWSGGSDTAPYDSWVTAAHNIQDAVNNAVEDNVVLVTDGVYTISGRIMISTNDIILKSVNGAEKTVINGNSISQCIYLNTVNNDFVIDGFSILNGKNFSYGAGIFVRSGSTILNCIFTNNVTRYYGGALRARNSLISNCYFYANKAGNNGGAVLMLTGSILKDCLFVNNIATNGGAIYCDGVNAGTVSDCIITSNFSYRLGGGAYCNSGGSFSNCIISNNNVELTGLGYSLGGGIYFKSGGIASNCVISGGNADNGGGVYLSEGGIVSDCTINENSSESTGGGATCNDGGEVLNCLIIQNSTESTGGGTACIGGGAVSGCIISNNIAGSYGGGAYCNSGGSVSGCTISENNAEKGGGAHCWSGGLVSDCVISNNSVSEFGGGVYVDTKGGLADCKIIGNNADNGGGVYLYRGGELTNCLIYGMNSANYGGGAYLNRGGELINCTIAGNKNSDYGGGIVCSNGGSVINSIIFDNQALLGNDNWLNYDSGAMFSYSCTTPTNGLPGGNNCISDDPLFINPGSDYHLQNGSPGIDAGYYMSWMDPPTTDLDGNPRIHDGIVDMGCYEFIPEPAGLLLVGILILSRRVRNRDKIKIITGGWSV